MAALAGRRPVAPLEGRVELLLWVVAGNDGHRHENRELLEEVEGPEFLAGDHLQFEACILHLHLFAVSARLRRGSEEPLG